LWGAFCPTEHNEAIANYKIRCQTKKGCLRIVVKARNAINILNRVDADSWWVGRVQATWWRNGKQFGVLGHVIDLLVGTEESRMRILDNPHIEVILYYYRKHPGLTKFKYDYTDSKLIEVDCVKSAITMSYNSINEVYTLDRKDSKQLSKFVTK
jgi:hypothetical protein